MLPHYSRVLLLGLLAAGLPWLAAAHAEDSAPRSVVVLVDESAYPELEQKLTRYIELVEQRRSVKLQVWAEPWYDRAPADIRARLTAEYKRTDRNLAGAIFVGPIPVAQRDYAPDLIIPSPLFYEDFDAAWRDADGDGDYDALLTDCSTNATEIWTAWWVPPANTPAEQNRALDRFLTKLVRQYESPPPAQNAILFGAGRVTSLRIGQGWAALFEAYLDSTNQRLRTYMQVLPGCMSVHCRDGVEFTTPELLHALRGRRWQHLHMITYGTPDRLYWSAGGLDARELDLTDFDQAGPILITCSASGAANFLGTQTGTPSYDQSIANQLLFAPDTLTTAFFGGIKPGAAGAFPQYHNELFAALDPAADSYLAEGYHQMRNSDHAWANQHYLFRGHDEIALLGDPFFRYYRPGL